MSRDGCTGFCLPALLVCTFCAVSSLLTVAAPLNSRYLLSVTNSLIASKLVGDGTFVLVLVSARPAFDVAVKSGSAFRADAFEGDKPEGGVLLSPCDVFPRSSLGVRDRNTGSREEFPVRVSSPRDDARRIERAFSSPELLASFSFSFSFSFANRLDNARACTRAFTALNRSAGTRSNNNLMT